MNLYVCVLEPREGALDWSATLAWPEGRQRSPMWHSLDTGLLFEDIPDRSILTVFIREEKQTRIAWHDMVDLWGEENTYIAWIDAENYVWGNQSIKTAVSSWVPVAKLQRAAPILEPLLRLEGFLRSLPKRIGLPAPPTLVDKVVRVLP